MSTTELFVELIVNGVSAAAWVIVLILAIFGYDWIPIEKVFSLTALVPILSTIYVLGIITDKAADSIFGRLWEPKIRKKFYKDQKEYFADKRIINIHPGRLGGLLEYGRSRMRICRGWALNSFILLIVSNIFIWTQIDKYSPRILISVVVSIFAIAFAIGSWSTWKELTYVDYRKVATQADFLRSTAAIKKELGNIPEKEDQGLQK